MTGLSHHAGPRIRLLVGLSRHFCGEGGIAGDFAHGSPHLVDGGGHLHGAIPLGGAVVLGELGLGGHLVGGGGQLMGVAGYLLDGAVDLADEVIEAHRDLRQLVIALQLGTGIQRQVFGGIANVLLQEADAIAQATQYQKGDQQADDECASYDGEHLAFAPCEALLTDGVTLLGQLHQFVELGIGTLAHGAVGYRVALLVDAPCTLHVPLFHGGQHGLQLALFHRFELFEQLLGILPRGRIDLGVDRQLHGLAHLGDVLFPCLLDPGQHPFFILERGFL